MKNGFVPKEICKPAMGKCRVLLLCLMSVTSLHCFSSIAEVADKASLKKINDTLIFVSCAI